MYAHLYRKRGGGWELSVTPGPRLSNIIKTIPVSGRREARAIAFDLGATPWNF